MYNYYDFLSIFIYHSDNSSTKMSIFSFYKLANTENGYHLVKDLVTFFSALLPMLSMTLSKHFMSVFVILDTGSKISTDGDYASVQMHKIKRRNLFYSILL